MPISALRQIFKHNNDTIYYENSPQYYRIEICGVGPDDFDLVIYGTEAAFEAWRVTCDFLRVACGWGYLFSGETNELIDRYEDMT